LGCGFVVFFFNSWCGFWGGGDWLLVGFVAHSLLGGRWLCILSFSLLGFGRVVFFLGLGVLVGGWGGVVVFVGVVGVWGGVGGGGGFCVGAGPGFFLGLGGFWVRLLLGGGWGFVWVGVGVFVVFFWVWSGDVFGAFLTIKNHRCNHTYYLLSAFKGLNYMLTSFLHRRG